MKKRFLGMGMLALALTFGMMVVGCPEPEPSGKKIKITGIDWSSGKDPYVVLNLWDGAGDWVAFGQANISNGVATVTLDDGWDKSGSYCIGLNIYSWDENGNHGGPESDDYFFTDGKTFAELGITGIPSGSTRGNLPKYNFSDTDATIDFSQFKTWIKWN